MKINIKKYLLYSSVFAIFTEAFFFRFIIDWKLLYLIVLLNYFLIVLTHKKIKLNNYFNILLLGLFIHGIICDIILGIPPNYMLSQLIGISIIGSYYYNFVSLYDKKEIIEVYSKMSFYIALIGFPLYFLGISFNTNADPRFCSILTEPAHYAIVVLPACYYFLKTNQYTYFVTLFLSIILSQSSLGFLGAGLMIVVPLLNLKRIKTLIWILPLVSLIFYGLFTYNEMVKIRVEGTIDSLNVINTGKFKEDTNLSSYALISNLFVAKSNFIDHPLGTGIGSHYHMYTTEYYNEMRPPKYITTLKLDRINAPDAASLFIRLLSELGILGVLLIFVLLYYAFNVFLLKDLYLEQGVIIYILLKLFRDGHYFPPEFFFFIWILYYSLREKKHENEKIIK